MMKNQLKAGFILLGTILSFCHIAEAQNLSKGEYLARAGDCIACHTGPSGLKFAGGEPLASPIGTIYSTNITPDKETGIGNYTLEDFSAAVRHGKRKDGTQLYPAMPYPSFTKITDEDIATLYQFFMDEVEPISNKVPDNEIPFVMSARWPLKVWNGVLGSDTPFEPDTSKSDSWNRGAYLVQGLGHCGTCHTPRGLGFAEKAMDEKSDVFLSGASLGGWYAPSLRLNGKMPPSELAAELKYGINAKRSMSGPMRDVVTYSLQYLSDDDIGAIVTYLSSLHAPPAILTQKQRSAALYNEYCSVCHGMDGKGISNVVPALVGNQTVTAQDDSNLINVVFFGGETATTSKHMAYQMPAYRYILSNQDLAGLLTYVRQSWGNNSLPVSQNRLNEVTK